MNNTPLNTDDVEAKSFGNAPTHGSFSKWLDENSSASSSTNSSSGSGSGANGVKNGMKEFADMWEKIDHERQVPEMLNYESNHFLPIKSKAKNNGPPSLRPHDPLDFTVRLFATTTPRDATLTESNYLVPKLDGYNVKMHVTMSDDNYLEKSWQGLSSFRKSHKGRLDSAKVNSNKSKPNKTVTVDTVFAPLPSSPDHGYSPSLLENLVPIRSKSEMSHREWHGDAIEHVEEERNRQLQASEMPIVKSRSSENVLANLRASTEEDSSSGDVKLTKSLNDYRLKVAKEDFLRQEIIRELRENSQHVRAFDTFRNHLEDDCFVIPELPSGKVLLLKILSTWGDKYYVGLNGIEIFADTGEPVQVKKIMASPPDVNVLPECQNDPRVAGNLLDGVNRTQDDVHLWLAPFEKGKRHTVTIQFHKKTTVAMIRIWNYNKSRIHSYRGVRDLIMYLDDRPIFKGEIAKACGGILGRVDAFGDTILFTTDEPILESISHNDNSYLNLTTPTQFEPQLVQERPPTSARTVTDDPPNDYYRRRPYTGTESVVSAATNRDDVKPIERIDLILSSNWGYANMIGLTGLQLLTDDGRPLDLEPSQITCTHNDSIGVDRLINGRNLTTNPIHMWCTTYDYTLEIAVTIRLGSGAPVTGIRLWNYNESLETTYAGASRMKILLDGKLLKNSTSDDGVHLLRRAPGNLNYDFVQEIDFYTARGPALYEETPSFRIEHTHKEEFYESSTTPEGFVVQFVVFSTWNDRYYCGLDGIELYDRLGRKILLDESNICAYPESINVLQGVTGDVRTPDKLIDGVNDNTNGAHSWLAPIVPKCLNRIYVVFDRPVTLSVVKLWNYSKTPTRGVKEFGILIDDLLVYNGILDKRDSPPGKNQYRTVVFTDDANVIEQELDTLIRQSSYGQDVVLLNDNFRSTTTGGSLPEADPALRPFTSVSPLVHTSHSH